MRARDLGLTIGTGRPGPGDAITDVAGVRVGHATLVRGDAVRTGVTVLFPSADDPDTEPVFAGCHRLNGNGELTGLEWVRESGLLTSPVALTNTHSVGVVRDALIAARLAGGPRGEDAWSLPVVGETWDGTLNDIDGMHVRPEHVVEAIEAATSGPVPEGSVGGGTGMIRHGFKGGIGTASRLLEEADGGWTVGVLVQANHGRRERLRIEGVPVGEELAPDVVPLPGEPGPGRSGSIIILVATGNRGLAGGRLTVPLRMLAGDRIDPLFYAVIEATEEAIVNAMLAAATMTGRNGTTAHRLDPDRLVEIMARYRPPPGRVRLPW